MINSAVPLEKQSYMTFIVIAIVTHDSTRTVITVDHTSCLAKKPCRSWEFSHCYKGVTPNFLLHAVIKSNTTVRKG